MARPSSIACALDVVTLLAISCFVCPVCHGSVVTRPDRHRAPDVDFEWLCNRCDARGRVHAGDATL